jgi:branched-chain amino acid transport system permease protein
MMVWLNVIINGLLMGSFYGMIALGLGLIYGVIDIVNFAHGAFLTLAMFLAYFGATLLGINPYLAIIPVALIMFGAGNLTQRFMLNPVVRRGKDSNFHLATILLTAGLSWIIQNGLLFLFKADYRTLQTPVTGKIFMLADMVIPVPRLIGLVASLVVLAGLLWFLANTDTGRSIRAISQDREAAQLMGIDSMKMYCFAFGLGTALVGIAACLLAPFYFIYPMVGDVFGTLCFIIVVLGGMGSILGTYLGGIFVGLVEATGAQLFDLQVARVLVFAIFVAVLALRPSGLFGRRL